MKDTTTYPAVKQAGLFLKRLTEPHGEGFLELRWKRGEGGMRTHFVPLPLQGEEFVGVCEKIVQLGEDGFDVYAGVLPRAIARGRQQDVTQAATVWVDLDAKNMSREEIEAAVNDADMAVSSGNGVHAYWWLTETLDLATHSAARRFRTMLEAQQKRVSDGRADSTFDLSRILRVPGTRNWKDRGNPKPVTLLWCEKRTTTPLPVKEKPEEEPQDEAWQGLVKLWDEACDWLKVIDSAKKNRLPELHPALQVPSGRRVSDPNVFIRGEWDRHALGLFDDKKSLALSEADIDFLLAHFKENRIAY